MQTVAIVIMVLGIATELSAVALASYKKENLDLKLIGTGIGILCLGLILYSLSAGQGLTGS